MRKLLGFMVVSAGIAATSVLGAGTAQADNGDGKPGCARGEICFWYDTGTWIQKQFWNTGNHGGNMFVDGNGRITNQPVQDNARDITNRDTACKVVVINYQDGVDQRIRFPNDGVRRFLGAVNNRNDRHERCV